MRLLIYYAKDSGNHILENTSFFLRQMSNYVEGIMLVTSEPVQPQELGDKIINNVLLEGTGHNFIAYRKALEQMKEAALKDYDQVICASDDLMGPIDSVDMLFEPLAQEEIDFWGLNKQHPTPLNYLDYTGENLQREYLPSYFMIFSKRVIESGALLETLRKAVDVQNPIDSWIDSKELFVTEELERMGYSYQTLVDTEEWRSMYYNPLLLNPVEMLQRKQCPFFLKESFVGDYDTIISNTAGHAGYKLMEYLKNKTEYDTDIIWESILKKGHQQDINHNLHLNYILDAEHSDREKVKVILEKSKVALVMHLYFMDLLEDSLHYASAMPECSDIYITTNTPEKKAQIEDVFSKISCGKLDVRVIENRGRDVSSLLVGVKDIIEQYEYVCFVHDKKSAQVVPGSIGHDFGYQCFENTMCNRTFVENVICTLYENKRLGMLSPVYPIHGSYFATNGKFDWGANYENTKELYDKLGLNIPISSDKSPVAPLGTMFWFKPAALKLLYDCDWEYEDFPPEPNGVDGTLLHAVERIYSYVVQQEGFYPAMLINKEFANIELTNFTTFIQGINRVLEKYYPYCSYQQALHFIEYMGYRSIIELPQMINELGPKTSLKWQIKDRIKRILHIKR